MPSPPVDFLKERRSRRPFADATTEWLNTWIPVTTNKHMLKLLLAERRRRLYRGTPPTR